MRLYRIGDKVVSLDRITQAIDRLLEDRERGATQEEAAASAGVQRTFVSFIESIGEVRRGGKIAVVGFPVKNAAEVRAAAEARGVDFCLVMSQSSREAMEADSAVDLFNMTLDTLAMLREYDTVVVIASDRRIKTVERILGREVVGWVLGTSPLRSDVHVDIAHFEDLLDSVSDHGGSQ